MLFNSAQFLIFFPIITIIYFIIPKRFQWVLLLAASYYFYMSWRPAYIILIIFSTLVDYFVAIRMDKLPSKVDRKKYLFISLFVHLSVLFAFKYYTFFKDTLQFFFGEGDILTTHSASKMLLPVGISFYTFKSLSYTIEIYRGQKP